jgi:hypothetical protein
MALGCCRFQDTELGVKMHAYPARNSRILLISLADHRAGDQINPKSAATKTASLGACGRSIAPSITGRSSLAP